MPDEVKYVRVGISPRNDRILDRLASKGFLGALTKVDVGRLAIIYALAHYREMMDWYRDRGLTVIDEAGGVEIEEL